ncbi:TrbL/VirB6 plasmid conjugal transfer protein [Leptothrix cholodnii SP-6]|uniref:TrbL/VirB6 plasmid conjugal transfer protein n=1 Tax=Leptothrix cholodnii (strain ATCC 51168 / LMG 8142 / SP-6) TaxID=395495 RepID=B1Y1W0_LEPCP|nr:type IV secretion system protein [Leptothrix cholodnii]ACB33140.1 TrbL/VirB6 plasmid conjugal transfer protein [Leptothrix cholodnii SP-6]
MYSWVGSRFDAILNSYVIDVITALMAALTPVALSAMTLWVMLYGWAVLRHEVSESITTFLWKVFKIGLVLAFALQSGVYITHVADSANALAMGVASTFLPAGVDPATLTTPYTLLDHFNDAASDQAGDLMKEASPFRLDLLVAAGVFSTGSVIFLVIGLFVVTLAKVLLTFVIAVGPLFILCLAWRPTARFFDSWLSMLLNAVVLTWFAFFALGLSIAIGTAIFKAIQDGGGFLGGTFNVLGEAMRYCVLMILMAILCFQAPSLASALTGGAAVQQGIQMIQNTLMVAGLRAGSSRGAGGTVAGGVVRAGTGIPFALGRAVGSAMTQAATTSRPAYRLAALRGRT